MSASMMAGSSVCGTGGRMGMVLVSEMFPLLSNLMDLGMRIEW